MIRRCFVFLALMLSTAAVPAFSQIAPAGPDPAKVRVRLGPLWMTPTISLTNLGVDNNVFNEPDDAPPKKDFTLTVTPLTDLWLRVGRTWVTGNIKEDLVWYQKYAGERASNNSYKVGWQVPLNRLSFSIDNTWINTRDRPGFEVDTRAPRKQMTSGASIEIRALSKTFFRIRAEREKTTFDEAAQFLGFNLREQLNRTVTGGGLAVRHQLTPLTSLMLDVSRSRDRFELSPLRDSNSTTFSGTANFDPAALIRGSASFGVRDFQPLSHELPRYTGTTAKVALSYTIFGTTRFTLQAARDVQYSLDIDQPYYLQTGFEGSVAQQVFGPFDVVARAGRQALDYRDRAGAVVKVADRVDHVRTYGGGVGYHMGRDVRIGFNIDSQRRTSGVEGRRYRGLKVGTAVTYGT